MDEFATGGWVEPGGKIILTEDDGYIIPVAFARKWAQELLDSINEDVIE